jgi:hypothetical protein
MMSPPAAGCGPVGRWKGIEIVKAAQEVDLANASPPWLAEGFQVVEDVPASYLADPSRRVRLLIERVTAGLSHQKSRTGTSVAPTVQARTRRLHIRTQPTCQIQPSASAGDR